MDEKFVTVLAKRLAAYSATAGVALAVAPEAGAQVVYHNFEPDLTSCWISLDFDDDGIEDLRVSRDDYGYFCDPGTDRSHTFWLYLRRPAGGNVRNRVLCYSGSMFGGWERGRASHLSSGEVVGPDAGFGFYHRALLAGAYCPNTQYGQFAGQEGYAGFRFVAGDGRLHYGWLRLSVTDCPFIPTVYEYGYEMTPNTPIEAGARSLALLGGAIDQTTFPASGGTLRYTFTVENTTDQPLPLDLWIDADGPAALTRRLGSSTLPPGATRTRTVRVVVLAGAPAGAYDVRFRLGHFASGRFVTFERYEVVKGGASAGASGEAFAVEPVAGDLFAEAEAASVLVGTHALSAPSPNPSTGRVGLSLEVAEAQHVTVTVHDALGRRVALLHDGLLAAGEAHRLAFDGSGLPAGVYVVRAVGETFADTRVVSLAR